eukprot:g23428.t1
MVPPHCTGFVQRVVVLRNFSGKRLTLQGDGPRALRRTYGQMLKLQQELAEEEEPRSPQIQVRFGWAPKTGDLLEFTATYLVPDTQLGLSIHAHANSASSMQSFVKVHGELDLEAESVMEEVPRARVAPPSAYLHGPALAVYARPNASEALGRLSVGDEDQRRPPVCLELLEPSREGEKAYFRARAGEAARLLRELAWLEGIPHPKLFHNAMNVVIRRVQDFSPKQLATVLDAYARFPPGAGAAAAAASSAGEKGETSAAVKLLTVIACQIDAFPPEDEPKFDLSGGIATAGKVFAMTKVYEPSSALSDDSDDDSSTESERERNAPKQLRVPPLPLLLDGKCGLPAKPSIPRLNCVHEDSMLSSDLLSSSEDEGEEELLVEFEAPMVSQRSQLASRCASASGLGAMAGTASGAVLGFLSGILPAPLTLGLSVPINAGLGSMGGMILGTAGGLICQSLDARTEVSSPHGRSWDTMGQVGRGSAHEPPTGQIPFRPTRRPRRPVLGGADIILKDEPRAMDAVVSYALKGGVAMGSLGGASGSAVGGLVGAAVGLPPAVLTFGLSVPVCATLGSSLGLCIGSEMSPGSRTTTRPVGPPRCARWICGVEAMPPAMPVRPVVSGGAEAVRRVLEMLPPSCLMEDEGRGAPERPLSAGSLQHKATGCPKWKPQPLWLRHGRFNERVVLRPLEPGTPLPSPRNSSPYLLQPLVAVAEVPLEGFDVRSSRCYLAYPFCQYGNLMEYVMTQKAMQMQLSARHAALIAKEVLLGVEALIEESEQPFAQAVSSVMPTKIFIDRNGAAKVLAPVVTGRPQSWRRMAMTMKWMSPEEVQDEPVDESNVWQVITYRIGLLLYCLGVQGEWKQRWWPWRRASW